MRLLEGAIVPDDSDDAHPDNLHAAIDQLRRELSAERRAHLATKRDAARGIGELRRLLKPWYQALQLIHGELDAAGADDAIAGRSSSDWSEWKTRLGPSCAKVIDALLLGGEMTVKAIMVSAKMGPNTVYPATSKMRQAGIITKNGGKFSLKKLS